MQVISKKRISKVFGCFLILVFMFSCFNNPKQKTKLLLITGGHDFDTLEFFGLFNSLDEYSFDTLSQPSANRIINSEKVSEYDILVFYDSWQTISDSEKKAYMDLTEKGKGFLFLHHSLVSYQGWDEFAILRGGRYHKSDPPDSLKNSWYKHDLDIFVTVLDSTSQITKGMKDFTIHDEGYSNIMVLDGITPLLKTNNPDCSETIAWSNKYGKSKIVYLMGGHDHLAYENENFRELIRNSLKYLSGGI